MTTIFDEIPQTPRPVDDDDLLSPCCLPQERLSAPCWPGVALVLQVFGLPCIMGEKIGALQGGIDFSPCQQGGYRGSQRWQVPWRRCWRCRPATPTGRGSSTP